MQKSSGTAKGWRAMAGVALALGILVAGPPLAVADVVKLAYVEFPPFTGTGAGGKPEGSLIDLMEKVTAEAGVTLSMQSAPARRLFQGLAEGEFHLFPGVKSAPALQGTTIAGDSVLARLELRAYALGTEPAVKSKEDLAGRKVIVLGGYSYGGWRPWLEDAANKVELIEARTAEQALAMLDGGRAPVLLQYSFPMEKALGGKERADLKSVTLSVVDTYMVVSSKAPDAQALLARLEAAYKKLKASGAIP